MKPNLSKIIGIGSVTPFGPLVGLIPQSPLEPGPITAWKTAGLRRAFLVKPFQPSSVVPGLKTRRLDCLSAWALVAASLALKDSGIDLAQVDRARVAVVFATGFGCIELTESFFQSAAANGWSGTDPITFPETLANSAAGHVALLHDLRGPNITISSKNFAGESALLQAASLLRHGQADLAVVIAGDTLTQTMYEWYETARLLSPACYSPEPLPIIDGYVPSEGVVAMVLAPGGSHDSHSYANLHTGRWATGGESIESIRQMLDGSMPSLTICGSEGAPCAPGADATSICKAVSPNAPIIPAQAVALGLADTGGLLHLLLALSRKPNPGEALMVSTSRDGGFAALLLELP